jgi:catechol 2,3-dioxygenase-like lactoylglutathione lyase family enzyme
MFSHIMLGTNDLVASRRFYDAVMPTLGCACHDAGDSYAGYGLQEHMGSGQNCLWLGLPADGKAATCGNGTNVALLAETREQVDRFYATALAAGALGEGTPGLRDVHPHFYAAYIRDPDGHKLVVVCHRVDG